MRKNYETHHATPTNQFFLESTFSSSKLPRFEGWNTGVSGPFPGAMPQLQGSITFDWKRVEGRYMAHSKAQPMPFRMSIWFVGPSSNARELQPETWKSTRFSKNFAIYDLGRADSRSGARDFWKTSVSNLSNGYRSVVPQTIYYGHNSCLKTMRRNMRHL